jgi:hypothetical protein
MPRSQHTGDPFHRPFEALVAERSAGEIRVADAQKDLAPPSGRGVDRPANVIAAHVRRAARDERIERMCPLPVEPVRCATADRALDPTGLPPEPQRDMAQHEGDRPAFGGARPPPGIIIEVADQRAHLFNALSEACGYPVRGAAIVSHQAMLPRPNGSCDHWAGSYKSG